MNDPRDYHADPNSNPDNPQPEQDRLDETQATPVADGHAVPDGQDSAHTNADQAVNPEAEPVPPLTPMAQNPSPTRPRGQGGWIDPPASVEQTQVSPRRPSVEDTQPPVHRPYESATRVVRPESPRRLPPSSQAQPRPSSVPLDANGLPLPQRVDEIDRYATRVNPAAYGRSQYSQDHNQAIVPVRAIPLATPPVVRQRSSWKRAAGCLLRMAIALLFIAVLAVVIVGAWGVYTYYSIAAGLPPIDDLAGRASQFETTRIMDRNGDLMYEILDPNAGRRTYVPLEKMSPYLVAATLATEDKSFYTHPGFDPVAILRALWTNYTTGETVSGASTITQQLARMLLLGDEQYERTIERKSREIVLAAEITRKYSKEEILELYLNEINYGNMAYGIEAAAETYFNTTADKLTLAQAAFLAGIPQAPGVYDIYTNREQTLSRQKDVVVLMYELSSERNCIEVSTSLQPVCVDDKSAVNAINEIQTYNFQQKTGQMRYPHWVTYIRNLLEANYGAQTMYREGFTVYTSLDPVLQEQAEQIVRDQVSALSDRHVTDGALVAIRPNTGEILALVGSADFYNEAISGQVNMALAPRQPGSAMKPLTYVAAFEKGWTPATLIWDVPSEFPPSGIPEDPSPPYVPVNYDGRFRGPVTVRTALSNSLNIPAVKALEFVGIYDNPNTPQEDGLISFARRLGITTLTESQYGLALTLGGGDVPLLELTGAYSVFANEGRLVAPVAITRIEDARGNLVYEYRPPQGSQVIRPEHAYLISSILSDNAARTPMFGANSVLNLPFPAAAKTGTTNDFRDNWTVGYTPDLAVGVWVGNADYTPMENTTGLTGAAPIWAQFMQAAVPALTGNNPRNFVRPAGIVDRVVCSYSGTEPSEWCPEQRTEIFAADQPPLPKDKDLWQKVRIDTWSGLAASGSCPDFIEEKFAINANGDPWAMKWIRETDAGRQWAESVGFSSPYFVAPSRECRPEDPRPRLNFVNIQENQTINTAPLEIFVEVDGANDLRYWRLEYGIGDDPVEWRSLLSNISSPVNPPGPVYSWDMKDVPAGRVTLRLVMDSTEDTYAERRVHINMQVPTPTPTPTATAEPTATQLPTATVTPQPTMTATQPPPAPTAGP